MKKTLIGLVVIQTLLTGCLDGDKKSNDDLVVDQCSTPNANQQLYDYMVDDYFWYQDLPTAFDPNNYNSMEEALYALRVEQDRFSFLMTEEEYQNNYVASKYYGFGFSHKQNEAKTGLLIRYVFDDGSAAEQGLRRGDVITHVDGVTVESILAEINAGNLTYGDVFGPNEAGHVISVTYVKPSGEQITVDFTKSEVTSNTVLKYETKTVMLNDLEKKVAYLVFNSFREISEAELNEAFDYFTIEQADEMILDLRYNSGGLVRVANQISTQMAGTHVDDEVFVKYTFNDKNSNQNQVVDFDLGEGIAQLNLNRITVLTTGASCSSSELVINSLSPHIEVNVIGDNTCGKPIGMVPELICDNRVFAINFQTQNSEGYGDYFDGLPVHCSVTEEITGDWGVDTDPLLAEGLFYLANGTCSTAGKASNVTKSEPDFDAIINSLKGKDLY